MILGRSVGTALLASVLLLATLFSPLMASAQTDYSDLQVQNASTVQAGEATPVASPEASPAADTELVGYIVGDPDAPVTLQIYHDYQCPYCRIFYNEVQGQLIEDYVRTGQVNLEFLDFTVVGIGSVDELTDDSKESVQAAEAAMCAAEQDAFLDYHSTLYSGEMTPNSGAFSDDNLKGFAEELGLDTGRFGDCLDTAKYEDAVISFVHLGMDRGVPGTPVLSINGGEPFRSPEGGYEALAEMIDAELGE